MLEISSSALTLIARHVDADRAVEACGLLFGTSARIVRASACRNVAADPAIRFEIDPAALIAAYRAERAGGDRVVGCYHSHPSGPTSPSLRDAADAQPNGWIWLIAGGGAINAFQAHAAGRIHNRFDPLPYEPFDDA